MRMQVVGHAYAYDHESEESVHITKNHYYDYRDHAADLPDYAYNNYCEHNRQQASVIPA